MDINQIQQTVEDSLKNKEDMDSRAKVDSAISGYLKVNKCTDEIVPVVIKAVAIDRGSNLFDYLSDLKEKDLQDSLKVFRNNKMIKDGSINGLRILVGMFYLSIINEGNISLITGEIIDAIVSAICSTKPPISEKQYVPVFDDYFINEFDGGTKFPDWKDLNTKDENILKFCDILSNVVGDRKTPITISLKNWIKTGSKYAIDSIENKKLEAQIPQSRISELLSITDHYKKVESNYREKVYEINNLQKQIDALEKKIAGLNKDKADLELKIKELHGNVADQQQDLDRAAKEIDERKALNDAFDAMKKNDESALLKDIGNGLKAEYSDFKASENDEMDITLGEIYREKIRHIIKILEDKGVKVD